MTFQAFLEKWNGQPCNFDGWYGTQCMDLMHQYIYDVLGLTDGRILAAPAAKDVFNNFDSIFGREYFDKIVNTPEGVPQEGDILFWGNGEYGHVAICISATINKITSFDANFDIRNCHVQEHTYGYCLGWLRFKTTVPTSVSVDSKVFSNLVRKSTIYDKVCLKLNKEDSETVILGELDRLIGYEDKVREQEKQLAEVRLQATKYSSDLEVSKQQLEDLKKRVSDLLIDVQVATQDNISLQKAVQDLKSQAEIQSKKTWWELLIEAIFKKGR